jgi:lipoyl(octanoyl) transferase
MLPEVKINFLGKIKYQEIWEYMKNFTETRDLTTPDELLILEHYPVFTLGLAGKKEHILFENHGIPIIHCDRGGQVTYHGPGQLIVYALIDLKRANISIRELVERLENAVINYLQSLGISAKGNRNAPGVYINGRKIASLGLKVRKGCTYHGLSFNINMDLTPFNYINVCGYSGLKVTQLNDFIQIKDFDIITHKLIPFSISILNSG